MSLSYLWSNRTKPRIGTYAWYKIWVKRIVQLPALMSVLLKARTLRRRGATLGVLASFSKTYRGNLTHLNVGNFSFVGLVDIQLHAPVTIGNAVVVNDGVRLLTGTHDITSPSFRQINRPITIGHFAWICTDAILLPGVSIGEGAVVAAGAVVAKDVPPYVVVGGNPARPLKQRPNAGFQYRPTEFRACIEAWIEKPW